MKILKKLKYSTHTFKLLFFFIFFQISSSLYFDYPTSIVLNNRNIFVIHRTGVTVCDPSFTEIVNNIYSFTSENEQISTEAKLSKVSLSKFDDGYIVSIIIDKIYIFDNEGNYKNRYDFFTFDEELYFTLAVHKVDNDYHYYLIGYINNCQLNLYYYKYDSSNNENNIDISLENFSDRLYYTTDRYIPIDILNKGITCQFIINKNSEEIIMCYYCVYINPDNYVTSIEFYFNGDSLEGKNILHNKYSESLECFQSSVNEEHTKSLTCYISSSGSIQCIVYDTFNYIEYDLYVYISEKCLIKYYGFNVDYFPDTGKFSFSCLNEKGIEIGFYNEDLCSGDKEIYRFTNCEYLYGNTLIYSTTKQDYVLISDLKCNEIECPFEPITEREEEEEEEEIEDNKEEEEIIKIEEENEQAKNEEEEGKGEVEEEKEGEKKENEKEVQEKEKEEENSNEKEEKEEEEKKENEKEVREEEEEREIKKEEDDKDECKELEKCKKCDKDSIINNLCIKCNNKKGYYYLNESISSENKYIECVNNKTKPSNFYFNELRNDFEICFELCATCEKGGDKKENNCIQCEENYKKKPDIPNSNNCVIKCQYFYYYTKYNQYKCTNKSQCPDDYSLLIKEKEKCIDKCNKDDIYQYQYDGNCLKECPNDTVINDYICQDINKDICKLSETEFTYIDDNLTDNEIEIVTKNFAKEFIYTNKHVSLYKNSIYTITLYKNGDCVSQLLLEIPEVDFGDCYTKVKNKYNISDNLIIALIMKNIEGLIYPKMVYFSMHDPKDGEKLECVDICQSDLLIVKEYLLMKIDNSKTDINSIKYLSEQNIDVFNKSSSFYTDICYHFDYPIKKDIALNDRILLFFPNITVCENNCSIKGVNLTSFKAICECKVNDIIKNDIIRNYIIEKSSLGEIESMFSQSNIEVIKCYKDIIVSKYFISNIGAYIILCLLLGQTILTIIYFYKNTFQIRKHLYNITDQYLIYLLKISNKANSNSYNSLELIDKNFVKSAPNKKKKKRCTAVYSNKILKMRKSKVNDDKNNPVNFKHKFSVFNSHKSLNLKNFNYNGSNDIINNASDNNYKQSLNGISVNSNEQFYKNKVSNLSNKEINNIHLIHDLKNKNDLNIEEYLSTDLEDMDYDDAIKKDKRKFCEYFCKKLKNDQIILNTFWVLDPLRPRTIKIILFILNIDLYFFINGLFFNEEYISEVFHSNKPEQFFTFIPRSIERFLYTTLVGVIVEYVIDYFFIEEKKIKGIFKREKDNSFILKYEITKLIKDVRRRNVFFIILSFLIIIFTLYYVFCFNNVYPHTKIEWIKSSIIIIIIMQIKSFLACLLETVFRLISFRCKSEKLYKISLLMS